MNKFWLGFALSICYDSFIQDLLGKDRYIETVKASWLNTPIWFWPILWVCLLALSVSLEVMEKGKQS